MVELLTVLAIIGIAAAVGIPSYLNYCDLAARKNCNGFSKKLLSDIERNLVTEWLYDKADADGIIVQIIDRNSAEAETVFDLSGTLRITDFRSAEGEIYSVKWEYSLSEDTVEITVQCSEHNIKDSREIRLFYVM